MSKEEEKKEEAVTPTPQVPNEEEALKACSAEVVATLAKYGYNLEIQNSIVFKKVGK